MGTSGASEMASDTPDPSIDEVLWTLVDDPEDELPEWPGPGDQGREACGG